MKKRHIPIILFLLVSCVNKDYRQERFNTYPPRIISNDHDGIFTLQIPVETESKNGKPSFIEIFKYYGFSGNGPSIEQVIRYNLGSGNAEFDSEGDCFRVLFSSKGDMMRYYARLINIINEDDLHRWVYNARRIVFKE